MKMRTVKPDGGRPPQRARTVADLVLDMKNKISGFLNHKTKHFSPACWLLILILFCGITGACCIYLIFSSIY
jgi:hypothetical protein